MHGHLALVKHGWDTEPLRLRPPVDFRGRFRGFVVISSSRFVAGVLFPPKTVVQDSLAHFHPQLAEE